MEINKAALLLKYRWAEIEDRTLQITQIIDELEEVGNEQSEYDVKSTRAYMLLELELKMLYKEQTLIEKTGALAHKE